MGMGEPLANFANLVRAIRIINAPWGLGIGARHITVSTSGLAPQIRQLAEESLQVHLAVSLHGATDSVRNQIMPVNRKYNLAALLDACSDYVARKRKQIFFEYILIAGVNDTDEQAHELVKIAGRISAKINLIPYNTVEGLPWSRPPIERQEQFLRILRDAGVVATLRREKGHDIEAACGQLRLQTKRAEFLTWSKTFLRARGSWPKLGSCLVTSTSPTALGTSMTGSVSSSSRITRRKSTWSCWKNIWTIRSGTKSSRAKWVGRSYSTERDGATKSMHSWPRNRGPARGDDETQSSSQFTSPGDNFEDHSLYRAAFALTIWIDQLFDSDASLQNEPSAVKLATHSALASAKLAAALSDDDVDEIGMTIAYLKRALKAITVSMDAAASLQAEKRITGAQHSALQQRLFQVRDGIITLMGEYRGEWRRRFGKR